MNFQFKRSYRGKIKAVVFDWAGTIVDYGSCAPVAAFTKTFETRGISVSLSQVRSPMGLDKKKHLEALLQMNEVSQQWQNTFKRNWNAADLDQLYRDFIPNQLACLKEYSGIIPGCLETIKQLKNKKVLIGTTTGYNSDMIGIVAQEASRQGLVPDTIVCSSDVFQGRPHPWMALEAIRRLKVYPTEAVVKIGDTIADVEEGLNAGMWTIGVAKTGNEMGASEKELQSMPAEVLNTRLDEAYSRLQRAGAHYVVDSVADIACALEEIESLLSRGEKP